MNRWALVIPLLLLLGLFAHRAVSQEAEDPAPPPPAADDAQAEDDGGDWGLNSLRTGFESVGGYFDSVLEFMGGRDGVCQYRCRYGETVPLSKVVGGTFHVITVSLLKTTSDEMQFMIKCASLLTDCDSLSFVVCNLQHSDTVQIFQLQSSELLTAKLLSYC